MISFVAGYYGWIGNQMFQYAATRAHAWRLGVACEFPRNTPDLHQVFNLTAMPPSGIDPVLHHYYEPHFHYDKLLRQMPDGTELHGYFQSEKYWDDYRDEIRREFTFRHTPKWPVDRPYVSMHIRRGDYLGMPEHHPPCTVDYYREAMARFPGDSVFLVFTDDRKWAAENFIGWQYAYFPPFSAAEDMYLMTQCEHHIIANSSFSWWGAYLGKNPDRRVIAPNAKTRWFGAAKQPPQWDTRDLLPESWERI